MGHTYEDAINEAIRLVQHFGTPFQVIEHVTPRGKYKGTYWTFRAGTDLDATIATFGDYRGQKLRIMCVVQEVDPIANVRGSIIVVPNPNR